MLAKFKRTAFALSLLFLVSSTATCYFGRRYEVEKIPPERRAQMSDTDWVGREWIWRGVLLFLPAGFFAVAGTVAWFIEKRRTPKEAASHMTS